MLERPERIGHYRLLGALGAGSVGAVYRARHDQSGHLVALKMLPTPSEAFLPTMRREIHALSRLRHPGIVRILDSGTQRGMPWLAMELLEGPSLRDRFGKGPVEATANGGLQVILNLVRRLCVALGYLHGEGLIHRDLKPENILLNDDDLPVLVDFGLASEFTAPESSRENLRLESAAAGTLLYMAPEQLQGRPLDARADLYALGCVFYELISGRPPFEGSAWEVCQGHLQQAPRPLSERVAGVPPALEDLVMRLLSKEPRQRPGYATDVAAELTALGARDGWSAEEPRPRAYLYRPGFAGRSNELGALLLSLEALKAGRGALMLIGGESGVGKTRLLMELGREAARRGLRVLSGECLPPSGLDASDEARKARIEPEAEAPGKRVSDASGRERRERNARSEKSGQEPALAASECGSTPLEALRKPLQSIADRCRELGSAETERLLGRWGKLLALYEPALAELPGLEAQPQVPELPAEGARLRLYTALLECFTALGRVEPLALLLDDLHWADELSLGFLQFVVGTAETLGRAPVLFVGAYRSEELGASPQSPLRRLLGSALVRSVALGRLEPEALAQMVGEMLSLDPPPELFVRFLARQSEGNPFFLSEYLRTAVTEEVLYRDAEGFWQVAEPSQVEASAAVYEALPLPGTLRELVASRLGGLGPDATRLLEAACVLGREFGEPLLSGVLRMSGARRNEGLRELLGHQILEEAGAGTLRFAHDKLREVAYEGLPRRQRLVLHRAAARTIEKQPENDRREALAGLGRHWELAGEPDRARPCYLQAARSTASRYALAEAEQLYRAYLRLSDGKPDLETIQARTALAGDILLNRGRTREAMRELEQALEEARRADEPAAEPEILYRLHVCHTRSGQTDTARQLCHETIAMARRIAEPRWEAAALQGLAINAYGRGLLEEALETCLQALEIQRQLGDPRNEARILSALAAIHVVQGRLDEGEATAEESFVLARQAGDRATEAVALEKLANVFSRRGDPRARTYLEQVLAAHREVGNRSNEGYALAYLADWHGRQGDSAKAIELHEQSLAIAREAAGGQVLAIQLANLSTELGRHGDLDRARSLSNEALALNKEMNEALAMALGDRSILERQTGELELAEEMLRRASEVFSRIGNLLYEPWCMCQQGHLLLARGQPARVVLERVQRTGESLRAEPESILGKAIARLHRAVEAFEAGRPLHSGECIEDLPEGLRRWLVDHGKLAPH